MADAPAKKTKKTKHSQPRGAKFWAKRVATWGVIGLCLSLILGVGGVAVAYNQTKLPDPNAEFQANTSFVYWRDGQTKMGNFSTQNRQSLEYAKMPQSIKDAAIAAENRTFWTDRGISITGMIRAAWTIARGGDLQGGSTITQQYIKILYLTSDRTVTRKLKELFLAVKIGREMPKEDILEGYLNTIYFGRGAYGIQAASRAYFNVNADQISVPQAAFLATVLNNPSAYDPSEEANRERILERYRYVLAGMGEMGTLTPGQVAEFSQKLPDFPEVPLNQRYAGPNGFLMKMVEAELAAKGLSQAEISGGGLKIVTTFDPRAQEAAVASVQKYTEQSASRASKKQDPNQLHGGLASVDNATGELIALYGGKDYLKDARNWATTPRQTASTFKTFALAAGLRDGFDLYDTFEGDTFKPKGDPVPVRNEFSEQYGTVNLIEATAKSINTAFVDLTVQMSKAGESGPEKIAKAASDAGAPKGPGWDTNTSRFSLGIPEVSPVNMAGAYATFANLGKQISPHVVREVFDAKGRSIYKADTAGKQAFDAGIARDVTYALESVTSESGTGSRVQALDRPVAGKTGTAGRDDDVIASWFVGYTKQITTSVMYVAGEQGTGDLDPFARPGDSTFFGGTYPALTWTDYMQTATKGQKVVEFESPAFVNRNKAKGDRPQKVSSPKQTVQPRGATPSAPATSQPPSSQPPATQPTTQPPAAQPTTQAPTTQAPTTQAQPTRAPTRAATRATQAAPPASPRAPAPSTP
ncbi:transglycosylase domain-containing protein [Mariniluteicoccus flavus]